MADGRSEKYYSYRTEYQCYQKKRYRTQQYGQPFCERKARVFDIQCQVSEAYPVYGLESMFCWVVFILRMADVGRGYGNSGCDDGIMPGSTTRHILPVQPPGMMFGLCL